MPPYYKNLSRFGFLAFLAFFITMNLLLTSCVDEPEAPKIEVAKNTPVAKVKAWFEENKTKLRLPERGSNFRTESQELILPFFEKEPDWDKFHHYYFPDGREVFEISLENTQKFVPSTASDNDQESLTKRMIQNILFVKHPSENRFDPLIVRYYPDEETSKRDFKEINYQMIDEKWSGAVDLFTYDEHHYIGFEIHKGKITETRHFGKNLGGETPANSKTVCYSETINWYQISTSGDFWHFQILDPTTVWKCVMTDDALYSFDPNDDPNNPWSPAGPSSYLPPAIPFPNLLVSFDHAKLNQHTLCVLEKIKLSDFVQNIAKFTKAGDPNGNTIITMGKTLDANANAQTQKLSNGSYLITLNENMIPSMKSLEIARTVLHELVHAEIYRALAANGVTPMDANFPPNLDAFVNLYKGDPNESHHSYMANKMLPILAAELMEIHKTQFTDDFQKFNKYMEFAYPSGLDIKFYEHMFWGGMEGTKAFNEFKASPRWVNYRDDMTSAKVLTSSCSY